MNHQELTDEQFWKIWEQIWDEDNIGIEFEQTTCDKLRILIDRVNNK